MRRGQHDTNVRSAVRLSTVVNGKRFGRTRGPAARSGQQKQAGAKVQVNARNCASSLSADDDALAAGGALDVLVIGR